MFGLLRWPGRIVPGVSNRLLSHLDLFPTFATLAGAARPTRPLDGEDMGPWLFVRANSTPAPLRYARRVHDRVLHIYNCQFSEFLATRVGKYKVWHKNDHKLPVRAASRKEAKFVWGISIHSSPSREYPPLFIRSQSNQHAHKIAERELSLFLDRWASSTIPMRTLLKHGPQRYLLASRSTSCLAQIVNSAGCWRRSTETATRPKKPTTLRTSPQRAAIRIYTTATVPSRTMVSPCSHRSRPSVSRRARRRRLPPTGGAARRRALTRHSLRVDPSQIAARSRS